MTDEPAPTTPTVRDRLTAAGLSAERIEQQMAAGRVRVDGELVTDLAGAGRDAGRDLGGVTYGAGVKMAGGLLWLPRPQCGTARLGQGPVAAAPVPE